MIQLEISKTSESQMVTLVVIGRKKTKNALKSDKGLKSVMAILAEAENSNQSFASALSTVALPPITVTLPIPPPGQVA